MVKAGFSGSISTDQTIIHVRTCTCPGKTPVQVKVSDIQSAYTNSADLVTLARRLFPTKNNRLDILRTAATVAVAAGLIPAMPTGWG